MTFRVGQEKGRSGWYVYVSKPNEFRTKKGSNTVRKKAGSTRDEALKNALRIEAEVLKQWQAEADADPFNAAIQRSKTYEMPIDEALETELERANYKRSEVARIMLAAEADPTELRKQGITVDVSRQEQAKLQELNATCRPWQQWVKERQTIEDRAASTVRNWNTKFSNLSDWYGSNTVGMMTRKDANAFKLHLAQKGTAVSYITNYIGTLSGFWNWARTSGELETENIWTGLKKGLPKPKKRAAIPEETMLAAMEKADRLQDIRFWFGRYQGLRKEDYCGLRWCDLDMQSGVMHLVRYEWKGKKRNLKLKEGGERAIPIHSKLQERIEQMLPDAVTRNDDAPIWPTDYKPSLENWGCTWAANHSYRYGFGSHALRSYVVTQMMQKNINPYYLHAITGHTVPGSSKVVQGYVAPTIEQVREVLELLD